MYEDPESEKGEKIEGEAVEAAEEILEPEAKTEDDEKTFS
jgi:hypothetical protein